MAAIIKGKQIIWGISAAALANAAIATTSGIVESFTIDQGGESTKITDEDGDIVARIDHGKEIKIDLEVKALSDSTVPEKGFELVGLGDMDGSGIASGRTFVESAKVTYTSKDAKKISISAVNYPSMPADEETP